jgi:hypothetical protein
MVLNKNSSNTVVITLNENQTTTSHDWLFEFTNQMTGAVKYCYTTDLSLYPNRYNKFIIIDNSTEIPTAGQLDFTPSGTWGYKVYEMPISSPPSLSPIGYLSVTEERECIVLDNPGAEIVNFDEEETKNNAIFNED